VFGISSSEFVVLIVVAAVVLGPERLPQYAQQLARLIKELRRLAQGASEQVRSELGPEFDDVDWRKLDPRQYDPRRIVREALADNLDPSDPLGLKGLTEDKPISAGGPGWRSAGRTPANGAGPGGVAGVGGGAAGDSAGDSAGTAGTAPADVPFDPDAT
jgi:sec-independent protein translocase protein TatB